MNSAELSAYVRQALEPPPKITVSEWADKNRMLSAESSAIPGQWKTSRVEYMREPMDCVGDPRIRQIVVMAAAQVAKSEFLNNVVGYLIDYDPGPILMIQPTIENAEDYSKDRISPMIRDTPVLKRKVADDKSKTSGNTIKNKKFKGGYLVMIGANSPSSLASRPIRTVLGDEVDRAPVSAGEEGDPINLAIKRTTTFWNRIIVLVSTPTNKGASRIETAYEEGDKRVRIVACPHCGHKQELKWAQVMWDEGKPETARYLCAADDCGTLWSDIERIRAVQAGEWVAQAEFNGIASFHVTGLLSPFASMMDGAREFLAARKDPAQLKVWVNTYLGETWEEKGRSLDSNDLFARREQYETDVPEGVSLITAGVDVQDDRLEMEVVGWGDNNESWSLDYHTINSDPSDPGTWEILDSLIKKTYEHPIFGDMTIRRACVDSGGHFTTTVYDYVRPRVPLIYAIKGIAGEGKPIIGRPTRSNIGKIPLVPVGVHTAKEMVMSNIMSESGHAGYCHWPTRYPMEYFKMLTAEKMMTRYHKGFKRNEFVKYGPRNEALDCRVYAIAARELTGVDVNSWRRQLQSVLDKAVKESEDAQKPKPAKARRQTSYVDSWRDY